MLIRRCTEDGAALIAEPGVWLVGCARGVRGQLSLPVQRTVRCTLASVAETLKAVRRPGRRASDVCPGAGGVAAETGDVLEFGGEGVRQAIGN